MTHMFSQVVLERLPYEAHHRVTDQVLYEVGIETAREMATLELIVKLKKDLLAHQVHVEDGEVPVRGRLPLAPARDILVELPRPWWARLLRRRPQRLWLPLGDEVAHRPAREVTLHRGGRAVVCPVVGTASAAHGVGHVQVAGVAIVRARYFRTFPEATVSYPDELGRPRTVIVAAESRGWAPEPAR